MSDNTSLEGLELRIGLKPFSDLPADELTIASKANLQSFVRLWLVKQGIPRSGAMKAKVASIAKAYTHKGYLIRWRQNANPGFSLLGGEADTDPRPLPTPQAMAQDDEDDLIGSLDEDDAPTKPIEPPKPATSADQNAAFLKTLFVEIEKTVNKLVDQKVRNTSLRLDDAAKQQIRDLATSAAEAKAKELAKPQEIVIRPSGGAAAPSVNLGVQHRLFPKLLRACQARNHEGHRLNIWLTGGTASGKTTAAANVAKAFATEFKNYHQQPDGSWKLTKDGEAIDLGGLENAPPFGADSMLDADYKVLGWKAGMGDFQWTTFLRIFIYGGVYLADEIDGWQPSALIAMNAALSNGWAATPIGMFQRHPDCIVIAAANTWGHGATTDYVARAKLDAATKDRFQPKIHWDYDPQLELAVAESMDPIGAKWCKVVQAARANVAQQGLKIIISPRATYWGLALLKQGFDAADVVDMTMGADLSPEQKKAIGLHLVAAGFDKPDHTNVMQAIERLAAEGNKLEAIRAYREFFDCDLLTAKNYVENLIGDFVR